MSRQGGMRRFSTGVLLALACAGVALTAFAALAGAAHSARNPADALVRMPIDAYRYDRAKGCVKHERPGALALQRWLEENALGVSWGIRNCRKTTFGNWSLHAEGRALDWHLDVKDPDERHEAERLVRLFLGRDRAGNDHALARRMGVQELIWNCRIWIAGPGGMRGYSYCYGANGKLKKKLDPSEAHRNHVHIGLNRAGAEKESSFWRQSVD